MRLFRSKRLLPRISVLYRTLIFILLTSPILLLPNVGQSADSEQALKAAIIYKLPKFVQWPETSFSNKEQDFHICLIGNQSLERSLNALQERKIKKRSVRISLISYNEINNQGCHLLFISKSKKKYLKTILNDVEKKPILTISDMKFFANNGGNIEIYRKNKHFAFRINNQTAKQSKLILAAPLLSMSKVIKR